MMMLLGQIINSWCWSWRPRGWTPCSTSAWGQSACICSPPAGRGRTTCSRRRNLGFPDNQWRRPAGSTACRCCQPASLQPSQVALNRIFLLFDRWGSPARWGIWLNWSSSQGYLSPPRVRSPAEREGLPGWAGSWGRRWFSFQWPWAGSAYKCWL